MILFVNCFIVSIAIFVVHYYNLLFPYQIYSCGDHAVTVSFGNSIDIVTHEKVMSLFQQLTTMDIDGIKDIIPVYTTVTVVYDIKKVKEQTDLSPNVFIKQKIETVLKETTLTTQTKKYIEIPVCYDVSFGPDLTTIASSKNLTVEEIISIHASTKYQVYTLGFLPGFPYMATVDDKIAAARLAQPRINVQAGSVGIAGNQTGIYPLDSPGGWNIIGRTPLVLFDVHREQSCLLEPGNIIKFVPITKPEFEHLKQTHEHPHS